MEEQHCDAEQSTDDVDDDFYLRYYVGHRRGQQEHYFTEFEVYASGMLRYAHHSEFTNQPLVRREVHLNAAVVAEFKRIVVASTVTDVDDQKWPESNDDRLGRQELECKVGRYHISFTTTQIKGLTDIQKSADPGGLTVFFALTQDLTGLVLMLINAHFEPRTT